MLFFLGNFIQAAMSSLNFVIDASQIGSHKTAICILGYQSANILWNSGRIIYAIKLCVWYRRQYCT